jgi:hypothetical protein
MSTTTSIARAVGAVKRLPPRRTLATLAVLGGGVGALLSGGSAQAAAGDLVCTATAQINFTPALTVFNTSAKASASGGLVSCLSPNGRYPNLRSAAITGSGTATSAGGLNPCSLLVTIDLNATAGWSPTGQKSKAIFTVNTDLAAGSATFGGSVSSGPLAGDSVTPVGAVVVPNADCLLNGLKSLTLTPNEAVFG